jgi:hypothetical protein
MSYHREIANQTLKNQTAGNVKIRCRLEKIGKTVNSQLKKAAFHYSMRRFMNDINLFHASEQKHRGKIYRCTTRVNS